MNLKIEYLPGNLHTGAQGKTLQMIKKFGVNKKINLDHEQILNHMDSSARLDIQSLQNSF